MFFFSTIFSELNLLFCFFFKSDFGFDIFHITYVCVRESSNANTNVSVINSHKHLRDLVFTRFGYKADAEVRVAKGNHRYLWGKPQKSSKQEQPGASTHKSVISSAKSG